MDRHFLGLDLVAVNSCGLEGAHGGERVEGGCRHLRTGVPCRDRIGLLNVLPAEGINLGLARMAEATNTHAYWDLMRISRWHVEGEALNRALAMVIEA